MTPGGTTRDASAGGTWGRRMRLRLEQFLPRPGDRAANLAHVAAAQRAASRDGVDLLLTPELSLTGYDLRDRVHEVAIPEADSPHPELAAGTDVMVGEVEVDGAFVPRNVALHLRDGRVLHRHRKVHLPTYGMFQEGRYFGRGERVRAYDAGGGWWLGMLVCEDLWHPALTYLLAADGAHVVLVHSAGVGRGALAGGAEQGRWASWDHWELLARSAAAAYGVYVAVCNQAGADGASVFAGGSFVVAPGGDVLARAGSGAERLDVELSLDEVARSRRPSSVARDDRPELVLRELTRIVESR